MWSHTSVSGFLKNFQVMSLHLFGKALFWIPLMWIWTSWWGMCAKLWMALNQLSSRFGWVSSSWMINCQLCLQFSVCCTKARKVGGSQGESARQIWCWLCMLFRNSELHPTLWSESYHVSDDIFLIYFMLCLRLHVDFQGCIIFSAKAKVCGFWEFFARNTFAAGSAEGADVIALFFTDLFIHRSSIMDLRSLLRTLEKTVTRCWAYDWWLGPEITS